MEGGWGVGVLARCGCVQFAIESGGKAGAGVGRKRGKFGSSD